VESATIIAAFQVAIVQGYLEYTNNGKIFKERFNGKYPARKSMQTEFAHTGGENVLLFQAFIG